MPRAAFNLEAAMVSVTRSQAAERRFRLGYGRAGHSPRVRTMDGIVSKKHCTEMPLAELIADPQV